MINVRGIIESGSPTHQYAKVNNINIFSLRRGMSIEATKIRTSQDFAFFRIML